jgi:hypothetical protein
MSAFTQHNISVIAKRLNKGKVAHAFTDQMAGYLNGVADRVLELNYDEIPVDTWNLMEGTGIGIYANGVLTAFRYDEMATEPRDGFWGKNLLTKAFAAGASRFSSGLWIVAFSTMPYAADVDREGGEFFSDAFVGELKDLVLTEFKLR